MSFNGQERGIEEIDPTYDHASVDMLQYLCDTRDLRDTNRPGDYKHPKACFFTDFNLDYYLTETDKVLPKFDVTFTELDSHDARATLARSQMHPIERGRLHTFYDIHVTFAPEDNPDMERLSMMSSVSSSSVSDFHIIWSGSQISKARHEIVCKALSSIPTDTPFGQVFGSKDPAADKTPDFIVKTKVARRVVEVATTSENSWSGLESEWNRKSIKYNSADMKSRDLTASTSYDIIIVSRDKVMTSFRFRPEHMENLVAHFQFGEAILAHATRSVSPAIKGLDNQRFDKAIYQELINSIERASMCAVDGDSIYSINNEMILAWQSLDRNSDYYKTTLSKHMFGLVNESWEDRSKHLPINKSEIIRMQASDIALATKRCDKFLADCKEHALKLVTPRKDFHVDFDLYSKENLATGCQEKSRMKPVAVVPYLIARKKFSEFTSDRSSLTDFKGDDRPDFKTSEPIKRIWMAALLDMDEKSKTHPEFFRRYDKSLLRKVLVDGSDVEKINETTEEKVARELRQKELDDKFALLSSRISKGGEDSKLARAEKEKLKEETDIGAVSDELKRQRGRVEPKISYTDELHEARNGVKGKSFKSDTTKLAKEARSSLPFSMDHDVSDISRFISSLELMKPSKASTSMMGVVESEKLLDPGLEGDLSPLVINAITRKFYRDSVNTEFGFALNVQSQIMEEVNASIHQFCRPGAYILKKLLHHDIWLLISPTSQDKHIFYSVAWKKSDYHFLGSINSWDPSSRVFRQPVHSNETEKWEVCDFVSVNRHRIHAYVGLHCSWAASLALFSELEGKQPALVMADYRNNQTVLKHSATLILSAIEGKPTTAASLQTIRYAYGDIIHTPDMSVDPLKEMPKMTDMPRSRFAVWILNKVMRSFKLMVENRPYMVIKKTKSTDDVGLTTGENPSGDNFVNLLSWVTGEEIKTYQEAVNLSYFGVVRNKDDADEFHGYLTIFDKVAKEEDLLKETDIDYAGYEDRDDLDYGHHEYSPTWCREAGFLCKDYIKRSKGTTTDESFEQMLIVEFSKVVARKNPEEYATFKASGVRPDNMDFEQNTIDEKSKKCIEIMNQWLTSEVVPGLGKPLLHCPLLMIDDLLKFLEGHNGGGLFATLFKKLQLTGVREIFILDLYSRLAVNFMEELSRLLGSWLPAEMMTKGNAKHTENGRHMIRVEKRSAMLDISKKDMEIMSCTDSDDATTWAQKFIVSCFGAYFSAILPGKLATVIYRILNLFINKKLRLPHKLLLKWYKNPTVNPSSENMVKIKNQFLNKDGEHNLAHFMKRTLINQSNMMQGIPHYTSSIFHTGHTMVLAKSNKMLFEFWKEKKNITDAELLITNNISSDDSAVNRTIIGPKSKRQEMRLLLFLMSRMKNNSYKYISAKQSYEKSSSCVFYPIREFNSLFAVWNTEISPKVKFTMACLWPQTASSFDDRVATCSNLRKQMIENGASHHLAGVVQCGQEELHYTLLGLNTSPMFREFCAKLRQFPHPAYGYFPIEPERLCGLFGTDFAEYLLLKCSKTARISLNTMLTRGDPVASEDAKPSSGVMMDFGDLKRTSEFHDRMMFPPDWKDEPFKNGRAYEYLMPSKTIEQSLFKVRERASGPSIADNFSFKTSSQVMAASVYCLVFKGASQVIHKLVDGKKTVVKEKGGLISLLDASINFSSLECSEDQISLVYPNSVMFDIAIGELTRFHLEVHEYQKTGLLPEKFNILRVGSLAQPSETRTLLETMKCIWFPEKFTNIMSRAEADFNFQKHKKVYPWLRGSVEETMAEPANPFKKAYDLCKYVVGMSTRNNSFKILGPCRPGSQPFMVVRSSASYNFVKGWELKPIAVRTKEDSIEIIKEEMRELGESYGLKNYWSSSMVLSDLELAKNDKLLRDKNSLLLMCSEIPMLKETDRSKLAKAILTMPDDYVPMVLSRTKSASRGPMRLLAYAIDVFNKKITLSEAVKNSTFAEFGYWRLPQSSTAVDGSKKWFGHGEYHGCIGRINYKVYVGSNYYKGSEAIDTTDERAKLMIRKREISEVMNYVKYIELDMESDRDGELYKSIKRVVYMMKAMNFTVIGNKPSAVYYKPIDGVPVKSWDYNVSAFIDKEDGNVMIYNNRVRQPPIQTLSLGMEGERAAQRLFSKLKFDIVRGRLRISSVNTSAYNESMENVDNSEESRSVGSYNYDVLPDRTAFGSIDEENVKRFLFTLQELDYKDAKGPMAWVKNWFKSQKMSAEGMTACLLNLRTLSISEFVDESQQGPHLEEEDERKVEQPSSSYKSDNASWRSASVITANEADMNSSGVDDDTKFVMIPAIKYDPASKQFNVKEVEAPHLTEEEVEERAELYFLRTGRRMRRRNLIKMHTAYGEMVSRNASDTIKFLRATFSATLLSKGFIQSTPDIGGILTQKVSDSDATSFNLDAVYDKFKEMTEGLAATSDVNADIGYDDDDDGYHPVDVGSFDEDDAMEIGLDVQDLTGRDTGINNDVDSMGIMSFMDGSLELGDDSDGLADVFDLEKRSTATKSQIKSSTDLSRKPLVSTLGYTTNLWDQYLITCQHHFAVKSYDFNRTVREKRKPYKIDEVSGAEGYLFRGLSSMIGYSEDKYNSDEEDS